MAKFISSPPAKPAKLYFAYINLPLFIAGALWLSSHTRQGLVTVDRAIVTTLDNTYGTQNEHEQTIPRVTESSFFQHVFTSSRCVCTYPCLESHFQLPSWQLALQLCLEGWQGKCDILAFNPMNGAVMFGEANRLQCNATVISNESPKLWVASSRRETAATLPEVRCHSYMKIQSQICQVPEFFERIPEYSNQVKNLNSSYGSTPIFNPALAVLDEKVFVAHRFQPRGGRWNETDPTNNWDMNEILICKLDILSSNLSSCFVHNLWQETGSNNLLMLTNGERRGYTGFQDPRVFAHNGNLYMLTSVTNWLPTRHQAMVLTRLDDKDLSRNAEWSMLLLCLGTKKTQKNWMPFSYNGELFMISKLSPLQIVHMDLEARSCEEVEIRGGVTIHTRSLFAGWEKHECQPPKLRGGSPLIEIEDGIFLGIVHWSAENLTLEQNMRFEQEWTTTRTYFHNFLMLNISQLTSEGEMDISWAWVSDSFRLPEFEIDQNTSSTLESRVQFVPGFVAMHDDLYISYGTGDTHSRLVAVRNYRKRFSDILLYGVHAQRNSSITFL